MYNLALLQPRVTQHCSGLWISELFQLSDSSERWYTILIAGYVRGIVSAVSHYIVFVCLLFFSCVIER